MKSISRIFILILIFMMLLTSCELDNNNEESKSSATTGTIITTESPTPTYSVSVTPTESLSTLEAINPPTAQPTENATSTPSIVTEKPLDERIVCLMCVRDYHLGHGFQEMETAVLYQQYDKLKCFICGAVDGEDYKAGDYIDVFDSDIIDAVIKYVESYK